MRRADFARLLIRATKCIGAWIFRGDGDAVRRHGKGSFRIAVAEPAIADRRGGARIDGRRQWTYATSMVSKVDLIAEWRHPAHPQGVALVLQS
jgi:hypothetical protein